LFRSTLSSPSILQVYVAKRDGAKNIFKQYLDSQGGELRVRRLRGCACPGVR